jgi:hypothetical protein
MAGADRIAKLGRTILTLKSQKSNSSLKRTSEINATGGRSLRMRPCSFSSQ